MLDPDPPTHLRKVRDVEAFEDWLADERFEPVNPVIPLRVACIWIDRLDRLIKIPFRRLRLLHHRLDEAPNGLQSEVQDLHEMGRTQRPDPEVVEKRRAPASVQPLLCRLIPGNCFLEQIPQRADLRILGLRLCLQLLDDDFVRPQEALLLLNLRNHQASPAATCRALA